MCIASFRTTVIDQARRDRQLFLKEVLHILLIIMLKRARLSSQNVGNSFVAF